LFSIYTGEFAMQRFGTCFAAVTLVACLTSAQGEEATPPQPRRLDVTKTVAIERPVKNLLVAATQAPANNSQAAAALENPKVAAGKVRWHHDFSAACTASQASGKPVILFQLMGNLDDRFC
jgi:hypothetical protein